MSKGRFTNYFENALIAPDIPASILADMPVNSVPFILSAIETRKGYSFWETKEDWYRALDFLNKAQVRLLMDSTDRIVNELRAMRNGTATDPAFRDPTLDPYTLPLSTLGNLNFNTFTMLTEFQAYRPEIIAKLEEVRQAILASGGGAESLEKLDTIIFLLGAL